VLIALAILSVLLLRSYNIPLIKKIEYANENPYTLAIVYAEEGKKYYRKCLNKIERNKMEGQPKPVLKKDADLERAKETFLHSLDLFPKNPGLYSYLADLAEFEGNDADLHYYQGMLNAGREKYDLALNEMETALEIEPNKIDALLKKADILVKLDRLDEAEKTLNKAREIKPSESDIYYLLARIEATRKSPMKSIAWLERSVELDPRNIPAAKMLAESLFAGDSKELAVEVLRNAETYAPKDANLKHRLGKYLYEMKRYEEAAEVLESAEELMKFSAPLYLDLARTYKKLGKERLTTMMLERAIKLDPKLQSDLLSEK
jgi:tetratricopeptide (TPR) repeat protein